MCSCTKEQCLYVAAFPNRSSKTQFSWLRLQDTVEAAQTSRKSLIPRLSKQPFDILFHLHLLSLNILQNVQNDSSGLLSFSLTSAMILYEEKACFTESMGIILSACSMMFHSVSGEILHVHRLPDVYTI